MNRRQRIKLEARRLRGLLAFHWVMAMPTRFDRLWWFALPWAGLFAHYDEDRDNWRRQEGVAEMSDPDAVLAEMARVKALFQARTIAAVIGAAPPSPQVFASETNKDRTEREDLGR